VILTDAHMRYLVSETVRDSNIVQWTTDRKWHV